MVRKPFNFLAFFISLYLLCRFMNFIDPVFRHLKYFLPGVALIVLIILLATGVKSLNIKKEILRYYGIFLILYLLLIVYSVLLNFPEFDIDPRLFEESFLILAPLGFCITITPFYTPKHHKRSVYILFWGIVIFYFFKLVENNLISTLIHPMELLRILVFPANLETGTAFIFGLLTVYFVVTKNVRYSLLGLLFTILSFKRIALMATILTIIAIVLLYRMYRQKKHHNLILMSAIGVNCLAFIIITWFALGYFDKTLIGLFGINPNLLTLGRQETFSTILATVGNPTWVGTGLGSLYTFVEDHLKHISSVHSDIVKNVYEFGIIGFLIWIFTLYKLNIKVLGMIALTIFINILFLSDNVFVYFRVMFVYYFLQMGFIEMQSDG